MGKHPTLSTYLCIFGERKQNVKMKNWKLQINLKMLKDELEEQTTPEKSGYPATSPLVAGEPFTNSQERAQLKETKEVVSRLHIS
jgi:hypothetical protein